MIDQTIITQNMKRFEAKYQLLKIALIAAYILIPLKMILEFVDVFSYLDPANQAL